MKLRKLMATKPHRYGTRHLVAGDEYEVPPRHAVALVAARKAKFADDLVKAAKEGVAIAGDPATYRVHTPAEFVATEPVDIDSLRLQATQLGIDVDGRWGVARLQHEIHKAQG